MIHVCIRARACHHTLTHKYYKYPNIFVDVFMGIHRSVVLLLDLLELLLVDFICGNNYGKLQFFA